MRQWRKMGKIFFVAFLLLLGVTGTTAVYAILTGTTATVTNRFSAGDVNTHIEEELGGKVAAGAVLQKTPRIVNDGPSNAFIRARITVSPADTPLEFRHGIWEQGKFVPDAENPGTDAGSGEHAGGKAREWYYNAADGFYYFNMVTSPDAPYQQTDTLFDAVEIGKESAGNFDVTIYQEAVYADGLEAGTILPMEKLSEMVAKFEAVTKGT